MSKNVILSDAREVPLLHFLWKWKISTTAALTRRFFPKCSGKTAYNRLLALRHAGLIRVFADRQGQKFVCTLDRKGFEAIKEHLPLMQEEGYKSEQIGHDLLASAFHLGEWLLEKPDSTTLYSEQQLRRVHPDLYPAWVPRSEIHRPDGYTQTLMGERLATVAIEVELSNKRDVDYLKIAEFYEHYRKIARVLWLVPRRSAGLSLQEKMDGAFRGSASPHQFILLEDFTKIGWHSEIAFGSDQGKTLLSVISEKTHEKYRKEPGAILSHVLLDTRKSPHTSDIYNGYEFGDFRD